MKLRSLVLLSLGLALTTSCTKQMDAPTAASGTHMPAAHAASPAAAPLSAVAASPAKRWSDPATWPAGRVPQAGEAVTIPAGENVLLDVTPPALTSLTIEGLLEFGAQDLELQTDWILLKGGTLRVGSEAQPFTGRATITLTDRVPGEDIMGMGDKFIAVMDGGTLDLHGAPRLSWTRLNSTAAAGANRITLQQAPGWLPGDRVVLASTHYNPAEAETATVHSVNGSTVVLNQPLKNTHWGQVETFAGRTLDERGEVGLLSRNVVVRGDDASSRSGLGGQVMVMGTGRVHISGTELTRMGQKGRLRRYPVHFHMQGDGAGSYVRDSSLHELFNRCLTIHGTGGVQVQNNVAYNTVGHCFFLEDGSETGNVLERNLGVLVRRPDAAKGETALLPTDRTPSVFWITHPANTVRGNVAGGSQGMGFWYAFPARPTGLSGAAANQTFPRRTPLGVFEGNVSHSNSGDGLHVDGGPNAATLASETTFYRPLANPGDPQSAPVEAVFDTFTAYKNLTRGVWLRGTGHVLRDAVLADNTIGVTMASRESTMSGGLIVGTSANKEPGTATSTRPLRGFEFYDGRVGFSGVHFANFQSTPQRTASALGYVHTSYPIDLGNFAKGATFQNAQPVLFERAGVPTASDVAADYTEDLYRAAVFLDADGSVGGTAGSSVVMDTPFLTNNLCTRQAAWNAQVCRNTYRTLTIENITNPDAPANIAPLTVTRLETGNPTHRLWGVPQDGPNTLFTLPVITQKPYALALTGATPAKLRLYLMNSAPGDWVTVRLPYAADPYVYPDEWIESISRLKRVSVGALATTKVSSYAWTGSTLTLKLMVPAGKTTATLDVCRTALCP